jgi:hypothetical protein
VGAAVPGRSPASAITCRPVEWGWISPVDRPTASRIAVSTSACIAIARLCSRSSLPITMRRAAMCRSGRPGWDEAKLLEAAKNALPIFSRRSCRSRS